MGLEENTRAGWQSGEQHWEILPLIQRPKHAGNGPCTLRQGPGCAPGGPVWSQASFLKVSLWQKVFEKENVNLLRLAAPAVQVQQSPEGGYGVTQATPRSTKCHLFFQPFPSNTEESLALRPETPPLPAQATTPHTCRNNHFLYPRTEQVQSCSLLGKLSLNMSFS